jgi:hypothetical protein
LVVAVAEPFQVFEENEPPEACAARTEANGEEVPWRVQSVALGDGESEIRVSGREEATRGARAHGRSVRTLNERRGAA